MTLRRARLLQGVCLAAALLAPVPAFASDVIGTITDARGVRGLQGTQVRIVELDRVTEAGRDGSFRFGDVPAGTYTIEASYIGADPVTMRVTVTDGGDATANLRVGGDNEILIVGQSASLTSALSRQRAADGVENVLTRDAVGQFPDQNVAESLRRVPGVNILNDQGEGRFVSVRGLDPELNSASVNGTRLPAPESDVRSVALDVIPAELIESIEIKKSLTPDMDGDTIGASIEINTTSAFDRKKDLFGVKLEGSYNNYSEALTPKASVDFSTKITENFGIAGGVSYYRRKFESDNIEAADWNENGGVVFAEEIQYRDYDVERERIGGSLSLDLRASDTTKLYARGLYSEFSDQEYRGDVTFIMSGDPRAGSATSAQFSSADGRIEVRRRMKDRFEKQKIQSLTLGGETETGPWKLTWSGAYAESSERENGSVDPTRFRARFSGTGANAVLVDFDYSDIRRPLFSVSGNTTLFNNPATYTFNELELTALSDSLDKEWTARADVAREFALDSGTFTVQAGVKSRWRTKSYDLDALVYDGYTGTGGYTLANVLGGQTYRIQNLGPLPGQTSPSDFFNTNRATFRLNQLDTDLNSATSDYAIDEDVLAGYLLGRYDGGSFRAIGGLRVERTYNDIRAFTTTTDGDDAFVTPNRVTRSYTDWLPSLTLRFEPQRNLVLRLAGYKSLVRPKLSNLAQRVLVNEDDEAEFGNPNLKPYRAWNVDASVEWYFGNNSALTGGVFWKSIKDFITTVHTDTPGSVYGVAYDEADTFQNGDTAHVKGIELSFAQRFTFLPGPLDGLLLNANYTFTDATGTIFNDGNPADPREIPLPSASKHTFNVVLGYEKGPLSLRVAGTYRDKLLEEVGDGADQDRYADQHFQLDLSAKVRVMKGVRLFADWVNVTDAPYFAYQNYEGAKRILQYEKYSWTAKFGVSANF